MKHTISVLVENHAGVLSRISGLFSRRGFNIDSLAVGVTDDPNISRITIVTQGNDYTVEQIEKQFNKLIEVIKVKSLSNDELISRELLLIKVNAEPQKRSEIMTIAEIMGAKIVDLTLSTITLEISDTSDRIKSFQEMLAPYGIKEIVTTGTIAIQKGEDAFHIKK